MGAENAEAEALLAESPKKKSWMQNSLAAVTPLPPSPLPLEI